MWGELVPSKIINPPFPVLSRLGIQCPTLIYVMFVWSGLMGGFVFFETPDWLVCYAHGFHVHEVHVETLPSQYNTAQCNSQDSHFQGKWSCFRQDSIQCQLDP